MPVTNSVFRAVKRDQGSVLIMALILVVFLGALSASSYLVAFHNVKHSSFMKTHDDLRLYVDSALELSLYDLEKAISGYEGKVGTTAWTPLDDLGMDGIGSTLDYGEGDSIPTPGEPNVVGVPIGLISEGVSVISHVEDTAWGDVKRVISTAYRGTQQVTIEVYASNGTISVPDVGAIYIEPDVLLDLKGNAFTIDGRDTNMDGSAGSEADKWGIATHDGDASYITNIVDQIPVAQQGQVYGQGGSPSVGGPETIDIDTLFDKAMALATQTVSPGVYTNVAWGTLASPEITYVNGDLSLAGNGSSTGILLVDGNFSMAGAHTFNGLVIVRGDVRQVGGGSAVHVFGSLMVTDSISVVDDPDITVTGTADIKYSYEALTMVQGMLTAMATKYTVVYRKYMR
jgi:hypothetical protein